jgi:hypothetical protein
MIKFNRLLKKQLFPLPSGERARVRGIIKEKVFFELIEQID